MREIVGHLGSGTALLCALHCLAMPVLATLSASTLATRHAPWLEPLMIGAAAGIGYLTLGSSYRRHRRMPPLALLTSGLALMIVSHVFLPEGLEVAGTAAGALALVASQWINRRCPAPCCARGAC